jgi:outer membrane protein assembly factor BamB
VRLGEKTAYKSQANAAPYYWAGKNGDASRTGVSAFTVPRNLSAGPSWSFHEAAPAEMHGKVPDDLKGLLRAAPLIDDKLNVYLSTVSFGNVYKFTKDGERLWTYNSGAQIPAIPALYDGHLFAATDTGDAFALDMETGKEAWRVKVANGTAGDTWSMTAADGIVIAATKVNGSSDNYRLVAVHASDGAEAWDFYPDGKIYNILESVKDGRVVFATAYGKVYCLDLQTGGLVWETPQPQKRQLAMSTGGAMMGSNGIVYVTWNEIHSSGPNPMQQVGRVGAYDFDTGARIWTADMGAFPANNAATVGPSGPGGRLAVVVGVGSNPEPPIKQLGIRSGFGPPHPTRVVALDAETGATFWSYTMPTWHGAALGDDKRPDICLPDAFSNAAIGGDGTVYFGFQNGNFYSLRDSDENGKISESEVSHWQTGAAFQGSPGIAPGMLVATPCNGMHVWRI